MDCVQGLHLQGGIQGLLKNNIKTRQLLHLPNTLQGVVFHKIQHYSLHSFRGDSTIYSWKILSGEEVGAQTLLCECAAL